MRHYSISEVVLLIRGGLPHQVPQLLGHLETCESCRETYRIGAWMSEVADRDRRSKPPEWVLERAKKIMSQKVQALLKTDPVSIPDLVFDSWRSAAPAFVRSSAGVDRHLVYRHPAFRIAVHVESTESKGLVSIAGQLQPEEPSQPVAGALVLLADQLKVLAHCKTDARGEWVFPATHSPRDLWIASSGGTIRIPLETPREDDYHLAN